MNVLPDITAACFNTPLVHLAKASGECGATLLAKLESFNPLSSVKDRIGLAMIVDAFEKGNLEPGGTLVEPTSGNTGIALAFVARVKGINLILTMPDTMSVERRGLLKHLGADLVLTDGKKGMKGAIEKARHIVESTPGAFMPDQFSNPANPKVHYRTTGPEIWQATNGDVDIVVAGVGTGGTISGTAGFLKEKNPGLLAVAVEPEDSPVISGGSPGPHKIQGIGAGFVPRNLNTAILDEVIQMPGDDAFAAARELALDYGILCGISSGANFHAAKQVARNHPGDTIVFMVCDTGERYLSTDLFKG